VSCGFEFGTVTVKGTTNTTYNNILGVQGFNIGPREVALGNWGMNVTGFGEYTPFGSSILAKVSLLRLPDIKACLELTVKTNPVTIMTQVAKWLGFNSLPVGDGMEDKVQTFQFMFCKIPEAAKFAAWFKQAGGKAVENIMDGAIGMNDNFKQLGEFVTELQYAERPQEPNKQAMLSSGPTMFQSLVDELGPKAKLGLAELANRNWCAGEGCSAELVSEARSLLASVRGKVRGVRLQFISEKLDKWVDKTSYMTALNMWSFMTETSSLMVKNT
jgi:hypothetical protein